MAVSERDAAYEQLYQLPDAVYEVDGLQVVHRYDDVRRVLMGELGRNSNRNSLRPLVGYGRIMRTPSATLPFLKGLFPLPAAATANAPDDEQHKKVWPILGDTNDGQFAVPRHGPAREKRIADLSKQFNYVWQALGYDEKTHEPVDVARLAIGYAALVTGEEVGLSKDDWELVAEASKAQSGLLGQDLKGRELGMAVKGLSDLFILCRDAVSGKTKAPISLAKRLADVPTYRSASQYRRWQTHSRREYTLWAARFHKASSA